MIGNTEELIVTINGKKVNPNKITIDEGKLTNTGMIALSPNTKDE